MVPGGKIPGPVFSDRLFVRDRRVDGEFVMESIKSSSALRDEHPIPWRVSRTAPSRELPLPNHENLADVPGNYPSLAEIRRRWKTLATARIAAQRPRQFRNNVCIRDLHQLPDGSVR